MRMGDRASVDGRAARRPGRPRSDQADTAILEATLGLLIETMSVDKVSVEAVATRSGLSKTTVYRRGANKIELIVEALKLLGPGASAPARGSAGAGRSVRADLIENLSSLEDFRDRSEAGRLFLVLLAEQERHPELYRQYFDQVVAPRREQVRAILQRGIDDGELRPDTDIETVLLCLSALQTRSKLEPDTMAPGAVERTVDLILHGILATGR